MVTTTRTMRAAGWGGRPSQLLLVICVQTFFLVSQFCPVVNSVNRNRSLYHSEKLATYIIPLRSVTVRDPLAMLEQEPAPTRHITDVEDEASDESRVESSDESRVEAEEKDKESKAAVIPTSESKEEPAVKQRIAEGESSEESKDEAEEKDKQLKATVIPMSEFKHEHFVGPVQIGTPPQTMHLVFDTGSTNVQVVGTACMDTTCLKVTRFNPAESETFEPSKPPARFSITFGTGRIHSQLARDTVQIGPFKVHNQSISVVDHEAPSKGKHKNIFDQIDFQGIVGFGFPSLASAGRVPFFDQLMDQDENATNEFAIYMGNPRKGDGSVPVLSAFLFGGVDPRFYEGPIQYVPVVREHYWEVKLDEFWVGATKFCCEPGTNNYVIFDSGTSFNTVPSREVERFRKLDGGIEVEITPDMYVIPTKGKIICKPAFMPIDVAPEFGHAYLLGSIPYMTHYFTLFRRGKGGDPSMVGIAKSKHSDEGVSFLQSLHDELSR